VLWGGNGHARPAASAYGGLFRRNGPRNWPCRTKASALKRKFCGANAIAQLCEFPKAADASIFWKPRSMIDAGTQGFSGPLSAPLEKAGSRRAPHRHCSTIEEFAQKRLGDGPLFFEWPPLARGNDHGAGKDFCRKC